MKSYLLSTVIVIYVVFVAYTSISFFPQIYYSRALDESFCECQSFSPAKLRLRASEEVREGDLRWIVGFFIRKKHNSTWNYIYNSTSNYKYFYFCTGTGE